MHPWLLTTSKALLSKLACLAEAVAVLERSLGITVA